jgi:DNA primase small subunit
LFFISAAACPQFAQREFSFTLENDVYRRYLSFSNHIEFEKELIKMCPEKIDIGAVYSAKVTFLDRLIFYY